MTIDVNKELVLQSVLCFFLKHLLDLWYNKTIIIYLTEYKGLKIFVEIMTATCVILEAAIRQVA